MQVDIGMKTFLMIGSFPKKSLRKQFRTDTRKDHSSLKLQKSVREFELSSLPATKPNPGLNEIPQPEATKNCDSCHSDCAITAG
ncbi:hypothetical protein [Parvularcula sp. IMCC14364]|uniref:hypothetical protein n=1 Tax=Parvularcula sp. IMCC14364 TaxID=3067902 RepID=UPI002741B0B7|nr:hypothetical protein [Parvularcula sp. IMCC14364]